MVEPLIVLALVGGVLVALWHFGRKHGADLTSAQRATNRRLYAGFSIAPIVFQALAAGGSAGLAVLAALNGEGQFAILAGLIAVAAAAATFWSIRLRRRTLAKLD